MGEARTSPFMLSAQLPAELRVALDSLASEFWTSDLAAAAERLSRGYRSAAPPSLDKPIDVAAYALTRMPATYGAVSACLKECEFDVNSVLDLGSGTGAAAWAGNQCLQALQRVTLVERNTAMSALGQRLSENLGVDAAWRGGDVRNLAGLAPHDLAVFSYSLGELNEREAETALGAAWERATKALLVVESGTPVGAARIQFARSTLIQLGATVAAPCPHDEPCPMRAPDWCHFAVRVDRSRVHRQLTGGDLGYEDERFAYVLAVRNGVLADQAGARVVRHPKVFKGHIQVGLCTPCGLAEITATKRDKAQYRQARKASWGSRWELNPGAEAGI